MGWETRGDRSYYYTADFYEVEEAERSPRLDRRARSAPNARPDKNRPNSTRHQLRWRARVDSGRRLLLAATDRMSS